MESGVGFSSRIAVRETKRSAAYRTGTPTPYRATASTAVGCSGTPAYPFGHRTDGSAGRKQMLVDPSKGGKQSQAPSVWKPATHVHTRTCEGEAPAVNPCEGEAPAVHIGVGGTFRCDGRVEEVGQAKHKRESRGKASRSTPGDGKRKEDHQQW